MTFAASAVVRLFARREGLGDGDSRHLVGTPWGNRDHRTYIPLVDVQLVRLVASCRLP
jgi:hypothetical protein